MAHAKKNLPPGTNRPEIDDILRYSWEPKSLQKAKTEYFNLLTTERIFADEDPNKYRSIYQKNTSNSIASYTSFGETLKITYPESVLVKMICDQYKNYGTSALREAMVQYMILQDVSQAYYLKTRTSGQTQYAPPLSTGHSTQHSRSVNYLYGSHQATTTTGQTGLSQTQYAQPSSTGYSTQQSRYVNLPYESHQATTTTGQPVVSVDEPIKYQGRPYYPESMYKELMQHKTTQEDDIYRLQRELKEKKKEVDELRSRLSSFASKQLTEGNPDFTDLSDMNRPDKMAERFHKIYDDEWTTSLESLTKGSIYLTEEKAISVLMDIIKSIYAFCTNYAEKQIKNMATLWRKVVDDPFPTVYSVDVSLSSGSSLNPSKAVVDEFKQHRKSFHKECIKIAIKNFKENVITKNHQIEKKWWSAVDAYVDVCVEVLWLMSVQNPPMSIEWPEPHSPFNNEKYKEYCKKGKTVKLAVWPAVFLNDKGPLINKGYAMPV